MSEDPEDKDAEAAEIAQSVEEPQDDIEDDPSRNPPEELDDLRGA